MKSIAIIVVCTCVGAMIFQFFKKTDLRRSLLQRGQTTTCTIQEIKEEGSKYKSSVCYTFQVGELTVNSCKQYHLSGSLERRLVGLRTPVIYDSTDPDQNHILIYAEDFQAYQAPYPDSLKWIEKLR